MRLPAHLIPYEIAQCAQQYHLGTPRIVYEPKEESRLSLLLGPFTLLAGSAIIASYYLLYDSVFSWWPGLQATLIPLVGVLWLVIGLWIICSPFIFSQPHVYICPGGLIYAKQNSRGVVRRSMKGVRWDEIEQFWKESGVDRRQKTHLLGCILLCSDGSRVVFTNELERLERLGAFLEREITRRHLPRAIAAYDAGKPVDFAGVSIHPAGIAIEQGKYRGTLLPWDKMAQIEVDDALVSISRPGDARARITVARPANVGVLKGLLAYSERERARQRLPQVIAYRAGLDVFFGRLMINKRGISLNHGEDLLPWDDIASIGVGESEVILGRKSRAGEWFALPIHEVANVAALRELLDGILCGKL